MKSTCNYRVRSTLKCRRMCCTQSHLMRKPERKRGNALNSKSYQSKLTYHRESPLEQLDSWRNRQNDTQED